MATCYSIGSPARFYHIEGDDEAGADAALEVLATALRAEERSAYYPSYFAPEHAHCDLLGYVCASIELLAQYENTAILARSYFRSLGQRPYPCRTAIRVASAVGRNTDWGRGDAVRRHLAKPPRCRSLPIPPRFCPWGDGIRHNVNLCI